MLGLARRRFMPGASSNSRKAALKLSYRRFSKSIRSSCIGNVGGGDSPSGGVTIINSLTGEPRMLLQDTATGEQEAPLTWYACGPTVYDDAHIGHARTYVTFDIILRILTDYLNIDVEYAMGITDIDDKIIKRASENNEHPFALARRFESRFFEDMHTLNVREPMAKLRVTEHIEQITDFITQIIDNGYAYEANGDVYFDVSKFETRYNYSNFRQLPDAKSWSPGEGEEGLGNKKHPFDFALWKAQKEGVDHPLYVWDSPWGVGRPGWHIECSAMSHHLFGEELSIHTGGVDLQFPHHNNEIAQCQAYMCGCSDAKGGRGEENVPPPLNTVLQEAATPNTSSFKWGQVWMHTGHLNIEGLKMSKSLKNFITIRQFLNDFAGDELRMYCLLHHYASKLDFTNNGLLQARSVLNKFKELRDKVLYETNRIHNQTPEGSSTKDTVAIDSDVLQLSPTWKSGMLLQRKLVRCRKDVRKRLMDNFDTPAAMALLQQLATDTQRHMQTMHTRGDVNETLGSLNAILAVWQYLEDILTVLGLTAFTKQSSLSSSHSTRDKHYGDAAETHANLSVEEKVNLLCTSIAQCRMDVRSKAIEARDEKCISQMEAHPVLQWSDEARDVILPSLGKRLNDMPDGSFRLSEWPLREQEQLRKRKEEEEKKKQEMERLAAEKAKKALIPPAEMFLGDDRYSKYDDEGVPTHDKEGEPLSKSARKKLLKMHGAQKKKYEKAMKATTAASQMNECWQDSDK
mmetsp:Transcript_2949/g.5622  ORF Transcript_2949/g.5622 Transcript_2949/m.5622 type:complete len:744 (+) Transcript_2949:188-2419(+)